VQCSICRGENINVNETKSIISKLFDSSILIWKWNRFSRGTSIPNTNRGAKYNIVRQWEWKNCFSPSRLLCVCVCVCVCVWCRWILLIPRVLTHGVLSSVSERSIMGELQEWWAQKLNIQERREADERKEMHCRTAWRWKKTDI